MQMCLFAQGEETVGYTAEQEYRIKTWTECLMPTCQMIDLSIERQSSLV